MKTLSLVAAALFTTISFAQNTISKRVEAEYIGTFNPSEAEPQVISFMYSTAAPSPGGTGYKSFLMGQKKLQSVDRFSKSTTAWKSSEAISPTVLGGTPLFRKSPNGTPFNFSGGIPNDNAMAISKDGILCAAINSVFWAYDTQKEELVIDNITGLFSLQQMANGGSFENYYDPKLIYDPLSDRFILVFLKDNDAANSRIIVAFSSTNNPNDPWHLYRLNGNPLDNNRWTDFPAIAISETGLVITGNLIIPNVSWQVGFDGSVIWHLDKNAGFTGGDVKATVYTQISHNGQFIRNLHPIRGHDNITDQFQFLSNRNFDLTNDTIFLITLLEQTQDTTLSVEPLISNVPYGVPPNGKQADTDTSDATKGLQTNDARVLGAIQKDQWIQFVSTTAHGNSSTAAIYHGFIDLSAPHKSVSARILWDYDRDYAYPNISWSGVHTSQIQCLIGFNFTSLEDNPGMACVHLGNDTSFSEPVDIINGTTYVDRHSDSYERWGDYFSIQPVFDPNGTLLPSQAWMAGFYGDGGNQNRTYIAHVQSNSTAIDFHPHNGLVYPNPVTDQNWVQIQFNLDEDSWVWGNLYDNNGRLVQTLSSKYLPLGPAEITLDLSTLAKGTYFVEIESEYGNLHLKEKVIKL